MEWKSRQAKNLQPKEKEPVVPDQKSAREAGAEALRRQAAARVEQTSRRPAQERENAAVKVRAMASADLSANDVHDRQQRRAEVYAINAVLRCVRTHCKVRR